MRINASEIAKHVRQRALAVAIFVVGTIVGGFILALCDDAGLFKHPWQRVADVIALAHWLIASPWVHWICGIIIGFAIGVWIDVFLRTKAGEKNSAPSIASVGGERALRLAGRVRAISERATRRDFKFPLPENDPWLAEYLSLEKSADPVWIDAKINQLRRDFIHACACIGDAAKLGEFEEREEWIAKAHKLTTALIKALSGEP